MKKQVLLIAAVLVASTSCQERKVGLTASSFKSISYYLNNTSIVSDAVNRFRVAKSVDDVSSYMQGTYGIPNFDQVYKTLVPYFKGDKSLDPAGPRGHVAKSLLGWDGILKAAGISKTSSTYRYISEMHMSMGTVASPDGAAVVPMFKSFRDKIAADKTLTENERNALTAASTIVIMNYDGFMEAAMKSLAGAPAPKDGRTDCWFFCDFWNIVVSIVITVIVVATAGAAIGLVGVEAGWFAEETTILALGTWIEADTVLLGAVIGAVVGAADAVYQATQDQCYTYSCGEDENIGMQVCSTGLCLQ